METLVDSAVNFHCRKGLRIGCDCSYCTRKRQATVDVSLTNVRGRTFSTGRLQDWEDCRNLVSKAREVKRVQARNDLARLKEQM